MMSDSHSLTIPPLRSGGLMLTYRCTNACRHCLYRCSPDAPNEWIVPATAERVFEALSRESRLSDIHLAGGEATLRMDRLIDMLGLADRFGVPISYLETNGTWCINREKAREGFTRLRQAGLGAVLVSASMFHNEFIPFRRTRTAVEAATEVFGPNGVIVWVPHLYGALSALDPDRTHTLEEFCERFDLADRPERLPDLYHLTPGGRVVDQLRHCYTPQPAEAFAGCDCQGELTGVRHFHIDPNGYLFTGLCPGIVAAETDDFHPIKTPANSPIFTRLCAEGPVGLMRLAQEECGYEPAQTGYVSKCDLCLSVRAALSDTGRFDELRPQNFYQG